MKNIIEQTTYCRKIVRWTGIEAQGACMNLPPKQEDVTLKSLIHLIENTVADCLDCEHKVNGSMGQNGQKVSETINETKKMLGDKLKKIDGGFVPTVRGDL